jgi:hypothetical protein
METSKNLHDIDDKGKIRLMLSKSKEFLVVLLERDAIDSFIDINLRQTFQESHNFLVYRVFDGIGKAVEHLEVNKNIDVKLKEAGMTGEDLDFKYNFFNKLDLNINKIWDSVTHKIRQNISKLKPWILQGLNYLNSIFGSLMNAGLPGIEPVKEIKDIIEIAYSTTLSRKEKS